VQNEIENDFDETSKTNSRKLDAVAAKEKNGPHI